MELIDAVTQQMNEELGDQEENPTPVKEKFQLRQKYGLSAPQFTSSEKYMMRNEQSR
jgi:hypothetical protein